MTAENTKESKELVVEAPDLLTFSDEAGPGEALTERPACLLETGLYPDKGLTLTEADLDGLVARFSAGLPVKVEHLDSPLDPLGQIRRVWRDGGTLRAILAFPADLLAFLRRRGAAKLSVGLSRDPLTLREVSLVLKPRVQSAAWMSAAWMGEDPPADAELARLKAELARREADAELARLKAELARREADAQVAAFKAQGRIAPAAEMPARALLASPETITFSDEPEPVARVFRRFLEAQPPVVEFGELPLGAGGADGFTQSEHTFLSRRLGVDPARVAARLRDEKDAQKDAKKENPHAY